MAKHDIQQRQGAGRKSSRSYRSLREGLRTILPLEVDSETVAEELNRLGVDPTFTNAISLRLIRKALEDGNVTAFQAVRDTVGEKPTDKNRLDLSRVGGMDLSRLSDQQLAELADGEDE